MIQALRGFSRVDIVGLASDPSDPDLAKKFFDLMFYENEHSDMVSICQITTFLKFHVVFVFGLRTH